MNVQAQNKPEKGQGYRGKPKATASRGLRERAWWVMREKRKFDLNALLDTVATGEETAARNNLTKFLRRLEAVGIVTRCARRLPGDSATSNGFTVWLLVLDVGRNAPVCRRAGGVYDPNNDRLLTPAATTTQEASDE